MSGAAAPVPGVPAGTVRSAQDVGSPIRGSALLLGGRFLAIGASLLVQVLIVRHLSLTDYGAFAYALAVVNFLTVVVGLGLEQAVQRFAVLYAEQGRPERIAGALVLHAGIVTVLGVVTVGAVALSQPFLARTLIDDVRAVELLLVMAALAPLQCLDGMMMSLFAVYARPSAIFWRRYVLAPGLKVAVAVAVVATGSGVHALAWGYVSAAVLGIVVYARVLQRILLDHGVFRWGRRVEVPARELLSFTAAALMADLVVIVLFASDVIIVGLHGGSADVALLQAVQPVANGNLLVFYAMIPLFIPQATRLFARGDREALGAALRRGTLWIVVFTFPVLALTGALARPLSTVMFGVEYERSGAILAVLAVGTYLLAVFGLVGLTLKAVGQLRLLAWFNVAVVVGNVGTNLVLAARFGPLGAAAGTAVALLVLGALKCLALQRATGVRVVDPAVLRALVHVALAGGALAGLSWGLDVPLALGCPLAAVASLAVLMANRTALAVDDVFPEVRRHAVVRLVLARPRQRP